MQLSAMDQILKALSDKGYDARVATPTDHGVRYIGLDGKPKSATVFDAKIFAYLSAMTHSYELDYTRFANEVFQHMEARHHDVVYVTEAFEQIEHNGNPGFLVRVYTFARADQYVPADNLTGFGEALAALENGLNVRRAGWNAKNQHVYMEKFDGLKYEPCFILFNAQEAYQPGWVPSMGDLRAKDWEILQPE